MISHMLAPRPDVLNGRIQGVVDPDRITDPKKRSFEAKPLDFAHATWVSADVRSLVRTLHRRLNSQAAEVGTILFEGPKGEGKSHLITLAYHLTEHAAELSTWLAENQLELSVPAERVVVLRKFTDFPLESLWQVIGEKLGASFTNESYPSLAEFRAAIGNRKLILLFDELESGVRAIADDARRQQNINFLQMISEESMRADSNVILIAAVYDGGIEPGLTLKRVNPTAIRFSSTGDRLRILFHRLFEKSPVATSPEIDAIVKSYANTWQKFAIPAGVEYLERFRESYPFTPELLDVVLRRIPGRGGFQGTRGALGFLAALVRIRGSQTNVLTLSDVLITDTDIRTWLADLEPSQHLISCAEANLRELSRLPYSDRIASGVLITSLAPSSRSSGITDDELARQVLDPASEFNKFQQTLVGFVQYASYFHRRDQVVFFDTKENAHAKVELRSLSVQESEAWERISQWWRTEVFGESEAIIFNDAELAHGRLDLLQVEGLRYVIAPRRLSADERHTIYFGLKRRNTALLFEPRDEKVNVRTNKDILAWAKRAIAAEALASNPGSDPDRAKDFLKIAGEQKRSVLEAIKKINFVYIQVHKAGASGADNEYTLEPIQPFTKEATLQQLSRNLYPSTLLAEHMQGRYSDLLGRKVGTVEAEYRNTLGFPVIVYASEFSRAIEQLIVEGVFNLAHPCGTQYAGEPTTLSVQELMDAVFSAPEGRTASTHMPRGHVAGGASPQVGDFVAGGLGSAPGVDTLTLAPTDEQVSTGFCESRQQLRQEVAARLDGADGKAIVRVRIGITFETRTLEMSDLPSFIRGSLTGTGSFTGEVTLDFPGSFTKAGVEEMTERLPNFAPGSARVTLWLSPK